jgi:HK97 family phage portal protein
MGIFDRFRKKTQQLESNSLFGNTVLGNNVMLRGKGQGYGSNQLLYVTTSAVNEAGRSLDITTLARNSTVMACVGTKARALAQLPVKIMSRQADGTLVDTQTEPGVPEREKNRAKSILNLLAQPNNFQSQYEFWYQFTMWHELAGETFVLLWRKNEADPQQVPLEVYVLDSTLIVPRISETRYPFYTLTSSSYGFNKDEPLQYFQVMHVKSEPWQGSSSFNRLQAVELISLDQDIDLYSNFIMLNGAKPSGLFRTEQVIPDSKFKEIAARLKEAWTNMLNSQPSDLSKPGQSMLLDQGMMYESIKPLTLQDVDARELKKQTMARIAGLFGVPPAMIGVGESKYNNTQTMLDEFYKSTMMPFITNIEQKLKTSLLGGYPNLYVQFQTQDFLKGAPLDQMNYVVAGVKNGILTPNEARDYLGLDSVDDGDSLLAANGVDKPIPGSSPQDTGGGGNLKVIGKTGRAGNA